jgi:hypothetical protein
MGADFLTLFKYFLIMLNKGTYPPLKKGHWEFIYRPQQHIEKNELDTIRKSTGKSICYVLVML